MLCCVILCYITLFNTQNVMETRLAELYYFEAALIRKWQRNFQLSSSFRVTVMAWNFTFFQIYIKSPSSKVGNTLSGRRNSHTTMKSRDWLSSLQVFITWWVKLLPVNCHQFLLSVLQKRSYCRWCPQVLSWELCRDSFSWHSAVIDYVVYYKNVPELPK